MSPTGNNASGCPERQIALYSLVGSPILCPLTRGASIGRRAIVGESVSFHPALLTLILTAGFPITRTTMPGSVLIVNGTTSPRALSPTMAVSGGS